MVLCPCRGMVWRNATVPMVTTLLARCWFASCPVRRELAVAFIIVSRPSGGISTGVGSFSHVVGCPASHEADDHDPELQGRGPC
jgi:hypothetical protein